MNIKDLTFEDIPIIFDIHIKSFPMSIFSQLGKSAVEKYYEWLFYGPHESLNIGIFIDAKLIGYCIGGKFNGALSGLVKRNKTFLLIKLLSKSYLVFSINFVIKLIVLIKDNLPKYFKKIQKKKIDYNYSTSFATLAKVYCQLSRQEGFGVALGEAMSIGCVPVVSAMDSIPEVVGPDTFYINEKRKPQTVAALISKVMSSKEESADIYRDRIQKYFHPSIRKKNIIALIDKVVQD